MFFEGDSESRNSLVVNSVDSAIPHSGISVRFDQLSDHRQIWSDVIKSGVHVQHLDQYLIHCNQLRNLRSFSVRVTWSATLHDWFWLQSHLRLNFSIFPEWRICPDGSYFCTRWRPDGMDLSEDLSRKSSPQYWLMCRLFPALLTASLLQYLVCSVDIFGLFLPSFSVLHSLAYFTPTWWNTHFIISKTYSCRSFQLFIIPIILSILSNHFLISGLPIILYLLFLDS